MFPPVFVIGDKQMTMHKPSDIIKITKSLRSIYWELDLPHFQRDHGAFLSLVTI